jgi:hypothetical protein
MNNTLMNCPQKDQNFLCLICHELLKYNSKLDFFHPLRPTCLDDFEIETIPVLNLVDEEYCRSSSSDNKNQRGRMKRSQSSPPSSRTSSSMKTTITYSHMDQQKMKWYSIEEEEEEASSVFLVGLPTITVDEGEEEFIALLE